MSERTERTDTNLRRALYGCACALLILLILFAFSHCNAGWDDPNPSAAKGSEEWPCGHTGQVCDRAARWQDDTCCGENETCPGPHAGDCTAGQCCASGSFEPYAMSRGDAGASSPRPVHAVRRAQ